MLIHKCDKCGKELEHSNEVFKFSSKIKLVDDNSLKGTDFKSAESLVKEFDLCQNCTLELFDFIGLDKDKIINTGCFDLSKIN